MKLRTNDTIVAIATPAGTGAISIVRLSGPDSISLADSLFRGNFHLSETPGYTIRHGQFVDNREEVIDEVLVGVFRLPHSYTGEDSVEISCHGGGFVTKSILSSLIQAGARQADPGEFTKRAFLNGKMDLAQAEAVADIVHASSEKALRNSHAQMRGALGSRICSIRDKLVNVCSLLELELDFSEDEVAISSPAFLLKELESCVQEIESSMATYQTGKVIRDGASVAIVGRPNVGKSSIFNKLLMSNRSIVSGLPGTTRDYLEESIVIDGTLVRLYDTAGLRASTDEVESDGISRTIDIVNSSDLILLVVDSSQESGIEEDLGILPLGSSSKVLIVRNKIDLYGPSKESKRIQLGISAVTGEGLNELRQLILKAIHCDQAGEEAGFFLSSSRHLESLKRARSQVLRSIDALRSGITGEFIAMDVRLAIDSVCEITGEVTTDDILNAIFSSFCIGK